MILSRSRGGQVAGDDPACPCLQGIGIEDEARVAKNESWKPTSQGAKGSMGVSSAAAKAKDVDPLWRRPYWRAISARLPSPPRAAPTCPLHQDGVQQDADDRRDGPAVPSERTAEEQDQEAGKDGDLVAGDGQ